MQPLRVGLWAPLPPPMGGVGRWTQRYLAAANQHELDVTLLDIAPPQHGFSEKSALRLDRLMPAGRALARLTRLLARKKLDVVHVTTTLYWATPREALVLALCKLAGVPTVLHVHSGNQIIQWRSGLAPQKRQMLDQVLRQATQLLVLSRELQSYLTLDLPGLPVARILNPVEVEEPPPGPLVLPPKNQPIRVLFVGALTPLKGIGELAEAVLALDNVELAVIGALGEAIDPLAQANMLESLEKLGQTGRLVQPGELTSQEVLRAYREADIFALPSHREGLPNVLLEAMAAGKPCVATAVGGMPDVLQDVGLLVPVADVGALTHALADLALHPERRAELGALAQARVRATCGTDVVMGQYRELYARVLQKRR